MRIGANAPLPQTPAVTPAKAGQAYSSATRAAGGDTLEISGRARDIEAARAALQQLPDLREGRVAALRAQIASGSYQVPSGTVAERMLASLSQE